MDAPNGDGNGDGGGEAGRRRFGAVCLERSGCLAGSAADPGRTLIGPLRTEPRGEIDMDKTWFIPGSSRGFGRAIAEAALERGDRVVATARNPEQPDDLVKIHNDHISAVALDVTDTTDAKRAVESAVTSFGSIDIVVNNAGYADSAPIEEMSDESFRRQIETNLFGVVNVTKAALPFFHQQRSGHFLQFSSIGGRVGGTPGMGAYQTAKFAVEGFSEVLNAEVKPLGIKVTIIEPGGFRTDWEARQWAHRRWASTTRTPSEP